MRTSLKAYVSSIQRPLRQGLKNIFEFLKDSVVIEDEREKFCSSWHLYYKLAGNYPAY